jgi:hypothetical protein
MNAGIIVSIIALLVLLTAIILSIIYVSNKTKYSNLIGWSIGLSVLSFILFIVAVVISGSAVRKQQEFYKFEKL